MSKYICIIRYRDSHADYDTGDVIEVYSVSNSSGSTWVYPKNNHPIPLDAFQFCFKEITND